MQTAERKLQKGANKIRLETEPIQAMFTALAAEAAETERLRTTSVNVISSFISLVPLLEFLEQLSF